MPVKEAEFHKTEVNEYRCGKCKKLLFKYNPVQLDNAVLIRNDTVTKHIGTLDIKCPRCEKITVIKQEINPDDWKFYYASSK